MKKLKVLFLSSEVAPFAKTGGLADVSNFLPQGLKGIGHEVRMIMPKYKGINERKYVLRDVIRLRDIPLRIGGSEKKISVKSAFTPDPVKIQIYFIDYKDYFGRDGLYTDSRTKKDYPDNDERFILFAKGVLETLKLLFWQPDIIHCNDWQTGLVPFFLKTIYEKDEFFSRTSTVFTIHNLGYQGNFPARSFEKTNVEESMVRNRSTLEHNGQLSFLKAGVSYADYITTVSEQYAKEIQESEEQGLGFQNVIRSRSKDFSGIINGVDYSTWNPETDGYITAHYSVGDLTGKLVNKKILCETFNLPFDENVPVIGIVSRFAEHKGLDLLKDGLDQLLASGVQLVILGKGDSDYHTFFKRVQKKYPDKIGTQLLFDEGTAHLIIAGSDMFLMPSRYEPCGLTQLYSLKYGTVPVVRKTGGLADTVSEFNPVTSTGNGFVFEEYTPDALVDAVQRAVKMYAEDRTWKKIMKNGMRQDFSLKAWAKKYTKIYEKVLKKRQSVH